MSQPSVENVRAALIAVPGKSFRLKERPTRHPELFDDKDEAEASLEEDARAIDTLQDRLYGEHKNAVLVVLQGIDTSGKGGVIRSVFAYTSPLGMQLVAFKAPSAVELNHDYLWRIHAAVPRKGRIGIFDRSHYEDVLVVKVRKFASEEAITQRYDQINDFERMLTENNVKIVKCMLNISHETQGERLLSRLEEPDKRWKFNPADLEDRKLWPQFMDAYERAIEKCSTGHAPWYVVPADSRTRRNAMIARLVRGALEDMNPQYPDPGYRPEDFKI